MYCFDLQQKKKKICIQNSFILYAIFVQNLSYTDEKNQVRKKLHLKCPFKCKGSSIILYHVFFLCNLFYIHIQNEICRQALFDQCNGMQYFGLVVIIIVFNVHFFTKNFSSKKLSTLKIF